MKKTHVFAIALLGAALGCVATQAAQVHYADAQYEPGQMRECSNLRGQPGVYPETTQIPPGWAAISQITGHGTITGLIICR